MNDRIKELAARLLQETELRIFLIWAKEDIQRELPCWKTGKWTPMLEAAICFLIHIHGVESWVNNHPWVTTIPEQPLHAAGFRTDDIDRYRQSMTVCVDGVWIHLYPEDAEGLFGEVARKVEAEKDH